MDDDGSLGIRNWGFFETPARNLGLQLMSSVPADRDTKQLLSNGPFLHHHGHQHMPHHPHHHPRDGGVGGGAPSGIAGMPAEAPSMPMNFVRNDAWMHPTHHPRESKMLHTLNADPRESKMLHTLNADPRESKMLHTLNADPRELHTLNADPRESKMLCTLTAGHAGHVAHAAHHEPAGYGMMIPGTHSAHTLQMMQQPEPQPPPPPKQECMSPPLIEENVGVINEPPPPKKRQQRRQPKSPKPKKPKKVAAAREDREPNGPAPRRRVPKKTVGMVINGIDLDLSRIPTPVCSCTGAPQQCYRWGAGGWQSACCTTTISTYPLPMSTKRRGARIAGRKMSQGAFKKVLEKLAGEGYNLNNPIDLKTLWAKHGTNKFVTIR